MENQEHIIQGIINETAYSIYDLDEYRSKSSDIGFFVDIPEGQNHTVALQLKGTGTIKLYKNCVFIQELVLTEEGVSWTDECCGGEKALYQLDDCEVITELDAHGNFITCFYASRELPLKKLVIYCNNLQELDCSKFTDLQFLHLFSNPLCEKAENMSAVVQSLPDRKERAMGSIIFYPWYGLETLIQAIPAEDQNSSETIRYVKYPYDITSKANFNHEMNSHYSWLYDSDNKYLFEEGRLYGIVGRENDKEVITEYVIYTEQTGVIQHEEMTNYHRLRKQTLEPISLPKNWVFGSAIMYDEDDWAKCPWDFRQNRVADFWETTEKGFGLTLGMTDSIVLLFPGAKYLNIVRFMDCKGEPAESSEPYVIPSEATMGDFFDDKITHGDTILSAICGNGAPKESAPASITNGTVTYVGSDCDQRFGYVPLCKLHLQHQDGEIMTQLAAQTSVCDSATTSLGYRDDTISFETAFEQQSSNRSTIEASAETHIFTAPAGNAGDGIANTQDLPDNYLNDAFYGSNKLGQEPPTGTIYVQALNNEKRVADYSQSSPAAERSKLTTIDYMCQYGQGIVAHKNVKMQDSTGAFVIKGNACRVMGTSYASPILNAMLMLLRIVYSKLPGADCSSFGKYSEFMNYVRSRWCDLLPNQMDFAAGYGMVDAFAEPVTAARFTSWHYLPEYDNPAKLGQPIRFVYVANGAKPGFTLDYNRQMFAATADGALYPIRASEENQDVVLHSNSARKTVTDGFYEKNYYEHKVTLSPIADDPEMVLLPADTVEADYSDPDFTILMLLDFLPEKMDPNWADRESEESNVVTPWFAEITDESFGSMRLEIRSNLSYIGNGGFNFDNVKLSWYFQNENDEKLGSELAIFPMKTYINSQTAAVVAFVHTKEGLRTYFNGHNVSFIPEKDPMTVSYPAVQINTALAANGDGAICYKWALTQQEVIQCTAALLRNYEQNLQEENEEENDGNE